MTTTTIATKDVATSSQPPTATAAAAAGARDEPGFSPNDDDTSSLRCSGSDGDGRGWTTIGARDADVSSPWYVFFSFVDVHLFFYLILQII
jgi:hypothetical protein